MKKMKIRLFHLLPLSLSLQIASSFTLPTVPSIGTDGARTITRPSSRAISSATNLNLSNNNNNRYDKELEQKAELNAIQKAQGSGVGETAAGAILGGLVLGPFGALFGASMGSRFGAERAMDKAKKEEMERMGITNEMLEQAREMGAALDRGVEGLKAAEDSLRTQQRFAKRLEEDMERIYDDAKKALQDGNEDLAKDLLFKRTQVEDKLKKALMNCVDEKRRLTQMEDNVRAIEERAIEMESLLKRSVGAKALMDASEAGGGFSLAAEDPLLQKFRDAGID